MVKTPENGSTIGKSNTSLLINMEIHDNIPVQAGSNNKIATYHNIYNLQLFIPAHHSTKTILIRNIKYVYVHPTAR